MTAKGVVKAVIAVAIIVAGALIGWAYAVATNPNASSNSSSNTPAVQAQAVQATPVPTFTPSFAGSTTPGAAAGAVVPGGQGAAAAGAGAPSGQGAAATGSVTPGAQNAAPAGSARAASGTPGQGQATGQRNRGVAATVESYDASAKILTVKDSSGATLKFSAANARVQKTEKVTADDFAKLAGNNGIVTVTGERGSDGVIAATSMTVVDTGGQAGGQAGGFGGQAGGFGGAGQGQAGGQGNAVIVRGGTLQGNKFTGSGFNGDSVTATLSNSTTLLKQGAGSLEDLKAGLSVTLTSRAATGDAPADAVSITYSVQ